MSALALGFVAGVAVTALIVLLVDRLTGSNRQPPEPKPFFDTRPQAANLREAWERHKAEREKHYA